MTARRDRLAVAARHAQDAEHRARASWAEATHQLHEADAEREALFERARSLAGHDLPSGLRGHFASVGARHLVALTNKRASLTVAARSLQDDYDAARARLRSLERVVERLDEAEVRLRRRQEEAELRDLVAARTNRRS